MLPSYARLTRSKDFRRALKNDACNRRFSHKLFALHVSLHGNGDYPPKIGFIVPKTVGSAVVRNYIKRQLKTIVFLHYQHLPYGCLVVIRVFPPATLAQFDDLKKAFDILITKAFKPVATFARE